ncbi:MAG: AAA family ATPase [Candidatus Brocadiales bacterium]|nr:AAA family ATPase [Candidatus Brocadiales bacterium]
MLVFKTVKYKNFLSTGNISTEIYLDKYNTVLVSGENGAGKSTMLDALTFVLFGKSFRGINIKGLTNSINEKDCVVEVEFSYNKEVYKVIRGQKPKIFEIYKNGNLIPQNATVRDYQQILEEQILKMSYKAFCQVVILGSSNYIPFMKLSNVDRLKIVEDLLDINIFSTMGNMLKSRLSENKDKLQLISTRLTVLITQIDSHKTLIERMENKAKESVSSHKEDLETTNKQIQELTNEVNEWQKEVDILLEKVQDENSLSSKLIKAEGLENQLKANIKKFTRDISFYVDNDTCPTCDQSITDGHKESEVSTKNEKIKELNDAINKIGETISETEDMLTEINSVLSDIRELDKKISDNNSSISASNRYITKLNDDIQEIAQDREELDNERERLEELEAEYQTVDTNKEGLVDTRTIMEDASSLIKEGGIKTKIIRYYLPVMNKLINDYLASMDFFCQFTLDEDFSETIKSRYRDDFTYYNFSEGERLRIDLSLLLVWREIARQKNSVNCNLLILDEVFDSSLDIGGTEEFLKILNTFGERANVFVITHKADLLMDKFKNHIHFEKKNNFSRIISAT